MMEFLSQASYTAQISYNETSEWSFINTDSARSRRIDDKHELSVIYGIQNTSFLAPLHSTLNYPLHSTIIDPHQSMQTIELARERPPCIGQEAEELNDSDRTSFMDETLTHHPITSKQRRKSLQRSNSQRKTFQRKSLHQKLRKFRNEIRQKKIKVLAVL